MTFLKNLIFKPTTISMYDLPILALLLTFYAFYRKIMTKQIIPKFRTSVTFNNDIRGNFVHRFFDATHFTISGIIGIISMYSKPFTHCFVYAGDCFSWLLPNPKAFECTILEKIYFLDFSIYYIIDFFYLRYSPEPYILLIHHIVSVWLITSCVVLKSPVVGPIIMILHDVVDIPLYLGKIFYYYNLKFLKNLCLILFAFMCTWFRIINFPFLIKHCLMIAIYTSIHPHLYRFNCSLLIILYILHLKWEYQIILSVIDVIKKKSTIRDTRSDDQ